MDKRKTSQTSVPYPGLRPFQDTDDSKYFFGRDIQIEEIIRRLKKYHFAAIMGGSGSGKSSIVRAGVVPKLRSYGISEQGDFWIPVTFTPGEFPITRLASELDKVLIRDEAQTNTDRRRQEISRILESPDGLEVFLSNYHGMLQVGPNLEALRSEANLLLVVDQFEEIFRQSDSESQQARYLVELLVGAFKRRHSQIYIILTLRSEDLHRCAAYLALPEVLNETVFLTRRLNENELEQAIENPPLVIARERTRRQGKKLQQTLFDGELRHVLYDELADCQSDNDQLPLLQHLLYRLWEHASTIDNDLYPRSLGIADLDAVTAQNDGYKKSENPKYKSSKQRSSPKRSLLARCLEIHADRVFESLGNHNHQQDVARVMFQLLAYMDNAGNYTRRWTTKEKIRELAVKTTGIAEYAEVKQWRIVDQVVKAYSEPHPYVRKDEDDEQKLDVSHEAFIRKWPRFRRWLQQERAAIGVYMQVEEQYLERELACVGKPGLIRCGWLIAHGFIPRRILSKVKKHKILERGESWVNGYQGQRGTVLPDKSAQNFASIATYIRSSKKFSRTLLSSVVLGILGLLVSVYIIIEKEKSELANENSLRALKLEAQVLHPFGVAARMEQPSEIFAKPNNDHYLAALWEGAVALKALMQMVRHQQPVAGENTKVTVFSNNQRERFERSLRLSISTVNQALLSLLTLPVWDLGNTTSNGDNNRIALPSQSNGKDDAGCRRRLALDENKQLFHVKLDATSVMPERGVYFDKSKPVQFTFYNKQNGSCWSVSRMGEAFDSELVHIDSDLRYYIVKSTNLNPETKDRLRNRFTFRGISWHPDCKTIDTSDSCTESWSATSSGMSILFGTDLVYSPNNELLLHRQDLDYRRLALAPRLVADSDEALPSSTTTCLETLNTLGYSHSETEKPLVCAQDDLLLAIAKEADAGADERNNSSNTSIPGKQIIELLLLDKKRQSKQGRDYVTKMPINHLSLSGDRITHLSFSNEQFSKTDGELNVAFASGYQQQMIWGNGALLEAACAILGELSEEGRKGIIASHLHSPFFKEIAQIEEGTIFQHNDYDCICGGKEQACSKSADKG